MVLMDDDIQQDRLRRTHFQKDPDASSARTSSSPWPSRRWFCILGALGMANMWEAVFADVGVSVIAILNAMRALKIDKD